MSFLPAAGTPARHALYVLLTCLLMSMAARGTLDSYAVFLLPISREFGWERTAVSGVYSVSFLVIGSIGPVVGFLFDRFGPLRLYCGGLALGLTALLVAAQTQHLWHLYLSLGLLRGLGVACLGSVPSAGLLSRWYRERLNTALALANASGALGMMVFAPLAQTLIDQIGWRHAYVVLALVFVLLTPFLLLVHRIRAVDGHPEYRRAGARGDGSPATRSLGVAQALRLPAFWGLPFTFAMTGLGMYAVVLQTPAFLNEIGYTPQEAARAFGTVGLLAPLGMVGFGWFGDRFGRRIAVLVSYACTMAGIACLIPLSQGPSWFWLPLFVLFFGGSFGSRGPAITAIAASIFRGPAFGRIFGLVTIGMGIGGGAGAFVGGLLHDLTGGYLAGQVFALFAVACGALPFLVVRALARA